MKSKPYIADGTQVTLKCEFRGFPAEIVFCRFRHDFEDALVDMDVQIDTRDYHIRTTLCFEEGKIGKFTEDLHGLITKNQGSIALESYTEESKLVFTAFGSACSKIIVDGNIGKYFYHIDNTLFGRTAEEVGRINSGFTFQFGGVETEQSCFQDLLATFSSIANHKEGRT